LVLAAVIVLVLEKTLSSFEVKKQNVSCVLIKELILDLETDSSLML